MLLYWNWRIIDKNSLFFYQCIIVHTSMHVTKWNTGKLKKVKPYRIQDGMGHEAITWSAETHVGNNIYSVGISIRCISSPPRLEINSQEHGQKHGQHPQQQRCKVSMRGQKQGEDPWGQQLYAASACPSTTRSRSRLPQPYAEREIVIHHGKSQPIILHWHEHNTGRHDAYRG